MSGQNNYLGKVTTQKMSENEMGNRGSKSAIVSRTVKEQRVDGSYLKKNIFLCLRYTLMGCESNYQIKILSKQLKNKK
jgi:hypothetical protein